jgi:iodotyrosine deiodinase
MAHPEIIYLEGHPHKRYEPRLISEEASLEQSQKFYEHLDQRRSVRSIASKPVSREVIENCLKAAATAPSGAHKQPWTFCVVSKPELKSKIREAAEQEEYNSYNGRMSKTWLEDLAPLGTDWHKPFLESAPYLIIVFKRAYEFDANGQKRNNYYVNESVGIACGFLISAIHEAGLVTLTHTPSPMNFLSKLLNRPENERPYLLLPVGYPSENTYVPDIYRKPLQEVSVFYE